MIYLFKVMSKVIYLFKVMSKVIYLFKVVSKVTYLFADKPDQSHLLVLKGGVLVYSGESGSWPLLVQPVPMLA